MENEFANIFISEAQELIESLEKNVLDLEKDTTNAENINEIFRVMHTLKGASDMFGFSAIREITHLLESLYDTIREKKRKLSQDILNLTFNTIDHLRKLLTDGDLRKKEIKEKHRELLKKAGELLGIEDTIVEEPQEQNNDSGKSGLEKFKILFKPNENILRRGINILNLFKDLAKVGDYVVNELPDKENENISAWQIILETDKGISAIEDVFMFVLEDCEISEFTDADLPENENQQISIDTNSDINDDKNLEELQDLTTQEENPNILSQEFQEQSPTITSDEKNDETVNEKDEPEAGYKEIGRQVTSRVSVDASKLDKLMNLVSELVTTNTQLNLINNQKKYEQLSTVVEKIESLSRQFRDNTLSIRLIPIDDLVVRFRRLIRDLSNQLNKKITFITEGTETELDKNIIDSLAEPLMHVLRNSIDHGIETPEERKQKGKSEQGVIKLSAYHAGANVYIQIQDDGAGLDTEKIRIKAIEKGLVKSDAVLSTNEIFDLIFLPGFSTAKEVTQISGRGVGMDVVKRKISEIQGDVQIESEKELGTIFTIKLRQTISIIDCLMVRTKQSYFLIPNTDIEFCIEKRHKDIVESQNHRIEHEQDLIPFIYLRQLFSYNSEAPVKEKLIIINKQNKRIAIIVDEIIGEHQAVIKPLGQVFYSQDFLVGASIMGDGNLALMLDINKLILRNNTQNKNKEVKNEY